VTSRIAELRDELRGLFTGERTVGDSAIPPVVFVVVNAWLGLTSAIVAALVAGALLTAVRLARGGSLVYAFGGIGAVAVAVAFVVRSGRAEGYFLPTIISNSTYAAAGVTSIVLRRPVTALASWFLHRWPPTWYWRDDVRPAYTAVTWMWVAYWASRAGVMAALYAGGRTELLAAVRVVSGLPLGIALLVGSYLYGTWRLEQLGGPSVDEHRAGARPPFRGGQRGF
jgi:hypothetical protein